MELLSGEYTYNILPARPVGQPGLMNLYNRFYAFWRDTWTQYLSHKQLPSLNKDELLRQSYLVGITRGEEVVSLHLYSIFDCHSQLTWECQYFSQVAPELKEYCQTNNVHSMMTQEYLAVAPSVRGAKLNVSFPILMLGLAGRFMKHIDCDSTVGTVRAGAPSVEEACRAISCDTLKTTFSRYETDHKFFIVPKWQFTSPGDEFTQQVIDHLWTRRLDFTPSQDTPSILEKIA